LAAIISVLCAVNAKAIPITYIESGTVGGSLNGTSFPANEVITLTGTGDTTNITTLPTGRIVIPVTASFTLSVSVGGVGSGTFTDAFRVFDLQDPVFGGIFGFTDLGPIQDPLDTVNAAFLTYAVSTPIGPITGASHLSTNNIFPFPTSVGPLVITSATGNGTVTAVTPLPAALPLFASGLAGLGLLGWRRKKKAIAA
jgi:hypothetical protein